jgi:hypothetical protein
MLVRAGGKAAGAIGCFRGRPILDIRGVAAALCTKFRAETQAIQALVNVGILRED